MKKLAKVFLVFMVIAIALVSLHLYYLSTLAAKEVYPSSKWLQTAANKTALIIVAHDDDMVGSSGTIAMLCSQGWVIREKCFYQQGGLYFKKDSAKNPLRKQALAKVAALQGMQGVDPVDFNFRNDMNTEQSYMPMPYSDFVRNYKTDTLTAIIAAYVQRYRPSVIFTLDDKMGGYGHPDHVVISQLVKGYCRMHKNDSGFPVKYIYQPVFPPSLAANILDKMPVYQQAKKVYAVSGMPLPDVQVNISKYGAAKKEAMLLYKTEQNSLRKIWPYYHLYPSWLYFKIFDRDFFRIVDVSAL